MRVNSFWARRHCRCTARHLGDDIFRPHAEQGRLVARAVEIESRAGFGAAGPILSPPHDNSLKNPTTGSKIRYVAATCQRLSTWESDANARDRASIDRQLSQTRYQSLNQSGGSCWSNSRSDVRVFADSASKILIHTRTSCQPNRVKVLERRSRRFRGFHGGALIARAIAPTEASTSGSGSVARGIIAPSLLRYNLTPTKFCGHNKAGHQPPSKTNSKTAVSHHTNMYFTSSSI